MNTMNMYTEDVKASYGKSNNLSNSYAQEPCSDRPLVRVADIIPGLIHALNEISGRTQQLRAAFASISGQRGALEPRGWTSGDALVNSAIDDNCSQLELAERLVEGLLHASSDLSNIIDAVEYIASGSISQLAKGESPMMVTR